MANRRAIAEFVGTFVLVFGGVGSAVIAGEAIGNLGVALRSACRCWRWLSDRPDLRLRHRPGGDRWLLLSKRMRTDEAIRYWIAQVLGAVLARSSFDRHQVAHGRV